MNAILLAVLALGGGGPTPYLEGPAPEMAYEGEFTGDCEGCAAGGHCKDGLCRGGWCGPMPQSCYNPSYGCYPSTRFMSRYPAFHGTYYRKAYNYRNYFDYPWHAALHEPTSHFSHHVPGEGDTEIAPQPLPDNASVLRRGGVRTAHGLAPITTPGR